MRILEQAIQEQIYENDRFFSEEQTWELFESVGSKKGVWIFGVGEGADFFLGRYGDRFKINGFIDNDICKQEKLALNFLDNEYCESVSESVVSDISKLKLDNDPVVLITSVRYCDEIYNQLIEFGVNQIFSLLYMEGNRCKHTGMSLADSLNDEKVVYSKKCANYPLQNNKILLARDELGGHGKQILYELMKLNKELDLVWITDDNNMEFSENVRIIHTKDWKEYIYELETAKIWLFGDMIPEFAIKRQGQIYIQLKHWASLTLKKFYMDLERYLEIDAIKNYYRHNSVAIDYIFVGSKFDEASCRSGFDFNGECVYVGSPRSDVLFMSGIREKVFSKFDLRDDVHILLYAPTFRSKDENSVIGKMGDIDIDFNRLNNALKKRFGGEWIIFFRVHPDVAIESRKVKKPEFVIDVTAYPDAEELVAASDVLISDYSSIIFEPSFAMKAAFRYAPDKDEYITKDRELLLDYDKLPFPLATNNDELEKAILQFDYENYCSEVRSFLDFYGVKEDGCAAKRAAENVLKLL